MLQYLKHAEIDFDKWDTCVRNSAEYLVYALSGYLEVSSSGNWDAVVEIQDDKYVSVFPAPVKKRLGISFVYQPLQLQQLGLFTTSRSKHLQAAEYLNLLAGRFSRIFLQLNIANTFTAGNLTEKFAIVPRVTYLLNLSEQYGDLKDNFSKNLKRNLKKAKKQPYQVTGNGSISDLIKLYRQTRGRELKDLKTRHYLLFEKQYRFLLENNLAEVREIRHEGELVGSAFFLLQSGRPVFLFSAASENGKKYGAMAFIIADFLQQHAGTETVLDFEGGSIPNLARFYGSFGAKPETYLSVSRNSLPWFLKWLIK